MLRSRFWLQNQDFGASVGAICIIFRDLSAPPRWKIEPPRQAGRQTKSTPQGKPQEEEKIDPPGHAGRQTEPTPPGKVWGG